MQCGFRARAFINTGSSQRIGPLEAALDKDNAVIVGKDQSVKGTTLLIIVAHSLHANVTPAAPDPSIPPEPVLVHRSGSDVVGCSSDFCLHEHRGNSSLLVDFGRNALHLDMVLWELFYRSTK